MEDFLMDDALNLAEALAQDIAKEGLAELVSRGKLRSLDSDTLVELEQDDDSIVVYENGDLIAEHSTDDEDFSVKLMKTVATSLNF